jgi:hypothetical protein
MGGGVTLGWAPIVPHSNRREANVQSTGAKRSRDVPELLVTSLVNVCCLDFVGLEVQKDSAG